jgi:UDP-N-acetylglucosamine diphosphorylase/glucosamine-1-phosphate N-acetyltransferase
MRLCVFEDRNVSFLEPLALTRPAFDLLCGAASLLDRQRRHFASSGVGALVRPYLAALCRQTHPSLTVQDADWLRAGPAVLVNARWLPPAAPLADRDTPRVGLVGDEVAYVLLPPDAAADCAADTVQGWVTACKDTLPRGEAGGTMIRYPWDLVQNNPQALRDDLWWFRSAPDVGGAPGHLQVLGPREGVAVHAGAAVEPHVVADTRNGPVMIDRGAVVQAFTRLEGPCYVGPGTWLLAAKFRGGTLGPNCRVGGEVEASIVHGHSNKYHDGFLGHSYVGEWVNLAAAVQVADLRHDYGEVSVPLQGRKTPTGLTKVGAFLGDHTKTGLATLLNVGTSAGVFCNLLPDGGLLPQLVPSYCTYTRGQLQERTDLRELFATAETVMQRRGRTLSPAATDVLFTLYERTADERRRVIREAESRRLRRSV